MKGRSSIRLFAPVETLIPGSLLAIILTIFVPVLGYSAHRLVVQDSGGETAFVVTEDGRVGIGISTPELNLDIVAPTNGLIRLSDTATDNTTKVSRMVLRHYSNAELPVYLFGAASTSTDNFVAFGGGNTIGNAATQLDLFTAENTTTPVGSPRLTIIGNGYVGIGTQSPSNPLEMASGAYVTTGGVWTNASSRKYKKEIKELSGSGAMKTLEGLNPVTFKYRTAGDEQHVGFIAEEVPELVSMKDRKGLSPMDIVAVLTKVVQEQQDSLKELKAKNERLEQRLLALEGKEKREK